MPRPAKKRKKLRCFIGLALIQCTTACGAEVFSSPLTMLGKKLRRAMAQARRGTSGGVHHVGQPTAHETNKNRRLNGTFMGGAADFAPSRWFKPDSKWGFTSREVHPGSEMASQNDQNKAK
jgi:hypothetical protein